VNGATHPSWCALAHHGRDHTGPSRHLTLQWSAPGRGADVALVDVGSRAAPDVVPVVRLPFEGRPPAVLLAPTEARASATTLVELAAQADAG
jgi:hypothetical protein